MSNYVERRKKMLAVNIANRRTEVRQKIVVTQDTNKQVSWFQDFVRYEMEKRKYPSEYVARLRSMPYKRYLLTPHWERVKKAAYGRFGRVCFSCATERGEIHVHHLSYANRGKENVEDLMILCKSCHSMVHEVMTQSEESDKTYTNHYMD